VFQVLDSTGKESVAVRLALGETQIVSQMREFLEDSGVHLDAFSQVPVTVLQANDKLLLAYLNVNLVLEKKKTIVDIFQSMHINNIA
jgi:multiple RNA-binding domain-containing protein 1